MPLLTGGCLCGAVRFELSEAPFQVAVCHCNSCRKHTGAPAAVYADCKRETVQFTRNTMTLYGSSPGVYRGFCARCGSTLAFESDKKPDEIHIHIGAFDEPGAFPPTAPPDYLEYRLAWMHRL